MRRSIIAAEVVSRCFSLAAALWPGRERSLGLLARAARNCTDPDRLRRLEARLRRGAEHLDAPADAAIRHLPAARILKPPVAPDEKGLIHVRGEGAWLQLIRAARAAERYDLLLDAIRSPHDVALLRAARHWPGPLYTLISRDDAGSLSRLADNLVPVPLAAGVRTRETLNGWFRAEAEHAGRTWSRDLAMDSGLALSPWYEDFAASYGLVLGEPEWSAPTETASTLQRVSA